MRIVSWNCRILGNPAKVEVVKDLLKNESHEILMLKETKIEGETLLEINKLKWKKNAGKVISARGSSGGLATLWSEDKFHLDISFETQHWIFTKLQNYSSKITFSLFSLYVPVLSAEKKECWQTLLVFLENQLHTNIIIAGDLNLVFEPKEKRGGNYGRDQMLPFVEEITQQWDLLDFKTMKGLFTWTNNRFGTDHIST
jgi:exonuclease III